MKKHLSTLIAGLCLAAVITMIVTHSSKRHSPKLIAVDKRLKTASAILPGEDSDRRQMLIEKIGSELDKLKKEHEQSYYFWLLKARHKLIEDRPLVKDATGHRASPSDIEGLDYLKKASTLNAQRPQKAERLHAHKEILLLQAHFHLRLDQSQKALDKLSEIWKDDQSSHLVALKLSESHLELSAKFEDKKTIDLHLNSALTYVNKSLEFSKQTLKDNDNNTVERYVSADALNQRALIRMRQKNYFEANLDLLDALKIRPQFPKALFNRGLCLAALSARYNKDPKNFETYQTQLLNVIDELRAYDSDMADFLYRRYYLKEK